MIMSDSFIFICKVCGENHCVLAADLDSSGDPVVSIYCEDCETEEIILKQPHDYQMEDLFDINVYSSTDKTVRLKSDNEGN